MLKLLKKFFQKEESVEEIRLKLDQLDPWLKKKIETLKFNQSIQEYFNIIKKIKSGLLEQVKLLQQQEISETDQKQVEERVKNIVKGHKENYAREIERFAENLSPPKTEKPNSIKDYQEIISFKKKLDEKLNQLAKRTAKSYQAAQHLFFKNVESIFNLLGELNKLLKEFDQKIKDNKIEELEHIQEAVTNLNQEIEKKKNLNNKIEETQKVLQKLSAEKEKEELQLKKINESLEYHEFLKLKEEEKNLNQKITEEEYKIYSFFSRLSKALRKYERVALDNSLIKPYFEDSVKAFKEDQKLEIGTILLSLKNSLDSLNFDEKQKKNYLELIKKSETGYLEELSKEKGKLEQEKKNLEEEMKKNKVLQRIESNQKTTKAVNYKIKMNSEELSNFQSTLEKIELKQKGKEVVEKIKKVLKTEITITI